MLSYQLETQLAIEDNGNASLSGLIEKYGPDARKQIYDYDTPGEKYTNQPKKIVVHHTDGEGCDPVRISAWHRDDKTKGTNGRNTSTVKLSDGSDSDVRYHYIIQADGTIDVTRHENEVGRGTRVNNLDVIHIAFCGDFTDHEPTKEQYTEGGKLIGQIRSRYGELPVYGHGQLEGEHTSCAGSKFDFEKLSFYEPMGRTKEASATEAIKTAGFSMGTPENKLTGCRIKDGMKCLGTFEKITAYYSPEPSQTRYFSPDRKRQRTFKQEAAMNGDLTPANSMLYLEDHKFAHGACGYSMLGKKLWIEGWSEDHGVFTCVDRGSGVGEREIDIRYGIGQIALNRIDGVDDPVRMVRHPLRAIVYELI